MWSVEDEQRLRKHIGRLKGERTMVRSTAVELESVHAEPLNSKNTISLAEARKLDLETAVLMQVSVQIKLKTWEREFQNMKLSFLKVHIRKIYSLESDIVIGIDGHARRQGRVTRQGVPSGEGTRYDRIEIKRT